MTPEEGKPNLFGYGRPASRWQRSPGTWASLRAPWPPALIPFGGRARSRLARKVAPTPTAWPKRVLPHRRRAVQSHRGMKSSRRSVHRPVLRKNNILMALDVTASNRDNRQER
jgi:hypothetical protein